MRKLILIAGFVFVSATAQAGDRSLSLGGGETTSATAPAKVPEGSRIVEAPAAEAPRYTERPAVVEPKAEAPKTASPKVETSGADTPKAQTHKAATYRTQAARGERTAAGSARLAARRSASMARTSKPRRALLWTEARIVRTLHRHGIYW